LATAVAAAQRGMSAVILERQPMPSDKACGEGLMPSALTALEALGARSLIDPSQCAPFAGIRLVQEDGTCAEAALPNPGGLGVRRTALVSALMERAKQLGVEARERAIVRSHRRTADSIEVETDRGTVIGSVLVAADGLASPLRRAEGLEIMLAAPRRFGLRRHFRVAPWSRCVEVHFSRGAEAYVTPTAVARVGVAFLFESSVEQTQVSFKNFLARFPALAEKLDGVEAESRVIGAGPMARAARARIADRFVLVGDAAGYVDAITGEGLAIAFNCALSLGKMLPDAIAHGASRDALAAYEREFAHHFRRYAWATRAVLAAVRRTGLRRKAVRTLARYPGAFEFLLRFVTTG
jgi:flavin-dependent dehydrogenase